MTQLSVDKPQEGEESPEHPPIGRDDAIQSQHGGERTMLPDITETPAKKPFSFYMSIVSLGLIVFVVSWDATSLAVALPAIAEDLHATTLESFWASILFMLGVAVTQPIYASISDIIGRKLPLYGSMILFAIGSILFAVAKNMSTVIVGRLLQGLGGGGMDVLEGIIISDITTLKERPLYLGLIGIPIATGSILGPIVGGLFAQFAGWRWIGWVNLPFVGSAMVMTFLFLHLRPIDMSFKAKLRRIDWGGMLLFAVGASALSLPLSWANSLYPWSSWKTILPFVIGVATLVVFAFYERKPQAPVLPHRVFGTATATAALIGGFLHGIIMYTMLLYLPLFFQAVFLQEPLISAKSILPVCCLTVGFSVISPIAVEITRRYRSQLLFGWLLMTLSLGLHCMIDASSSLAMAFGFQVILGAGVGIVFTATAIPLQASVKHVDDTGLAAGILIVVRLFGALVGLAVGSAIFNSVFEKTIGTVNPFPAAIEILKDPSQAIMFIPNLRALDLSPETMRSIVEAYRVPFRGIWIFLTCLSGAGLAASLFLKELNLENEELGRQRFDEPTP
ncbi:MFS general substrate transporter [Thozetella sp. PMI_491]|nr:MFS general substrate transporter [Thozetella sp. PMI_491]